MSNKSAPEPQDNRAAKWWSLPRRPAVQQIDPQLQVRRQQKVAARLRLWTSVLQTRSDEQDRRGCLASHCMAWHTLLEGASGRYHMPRYAPPHPKKKRTKESDTRARQEQTRQGSPDVGAGAAPSSQSPQEPDDWSGGDGQQRFWARGGAVSAAWGPSKREVQAASPGPQRRRNREPSLVAASG